MVPGDYVVSNLATLMYNEHKDDSILGFTAAGLVVRNRVLAGWYGGDWITLISKHYTFSAYPNENMDQPAWKLGDPHHDTIFRRCLGIADQIYNGREKDIAEGALFYCRLDNCSEEFKLNIIRQPENHPMVARVGMQMFFK